MLEKREALSNEEASAKSKLIIEKLKKEKDYIKSKVVMFYASKDKEVMTHDIIKEAMKTKKVIVPKVTSNGLICCQVDDFGKMNYSCFGILEPNEEISCEVSKIDIIIVPGIAFDKKGNRIGYGKGYYDTLLKKAKCPKIALAYDFQIVPTIKTDKWDVPVDKVITN